MILSSQKLKPAIELSSPTTSSAAAAVVEEPFNCEFKLFFVEVEF